MQPHIPVLLQNSEADWRTQETNLRHGCISTPGALDPRGRELSLSRFGTGLRLPKQQRGTSIASRDTLRLFDLHPDCLHVSLTQMLSRDAETRWAALLRRLTAQYALDNQHQAIVTQCYLDDPAAHIRKLANDREYAGNAMLLSHTWNLLWIVGSRGFCLPIFDHTILSLQSDNFG